MNSKDNRRGVAGVVVAGLALTLTGGTTALAVSANDAPTARVQQAQAGALSRAETRQVKKIARKMAKKMARRISKRQIRRMAPDLAVASALTAGQAQNAITAQTAANATHALSADMAVNAQNAVNAAKVGGFDVEKINVVIAPGGPDVRLIDSAGFSLTASCVAGAIDLRVASSVPGGRLRSADIDNNEVVFTQGSNNLGAGFSIHGAGVSLGSATLEFVAADGSVVNAWVGYRDDGPGCAYFGNYMFG